jgi:hypothetical protein
MGREAASAPETDRMSIQDQNIPGLPSQPTGPFFPRRSALRIARAARGNPVEIHFAAGAWSG